MERDRPIVVTLPARDDSDPWNVGSPGPLALRAGGGDLNGAISACGVHGLERGGQAEPARPARLRDFQALTFDLD
jgi:hypothetical protein